MLGLWAFLRVALVKALALGCGILLGTVLAMVPMDPDPGFFYHSLLSVLTHWFDWPGDSVSFIASAEWGAALYMACYTGLAASVLWGVLCWRGPKGWRSAAVLGAVLGAMAAALTFWDGDHDRLAMPILCGIYALVGAVTGLFVRMLDRRLLPT